MADLQEEIQRLHNQLEESKRWNASLQSRGIQQQQRGGGVGGANDSSANQVPSDGHVTGVSPMGVGDSGVLGPINVVGGGTVLVLDDSALSKMSPAVLKEYFGQLYSQLGAERKQSLALQAQLDAIAGVRYIPGQNDEDLSTMTPVELRQELLAARVQLGKREAQAEALQRHLVDGNGTNSDKSPQFRGDEILAMSEAQLKRAVNILNNQLKRSDAEKMALQKQLMTVDQMLDTSKTEADPSYLSANQLRDEVTKLRYQLERLRSQKDTLQGQLKVVDESFSIAAAELSADLSHTTADDTSKDHEKLKSQLQQLHAQNRQLVAELQSLKDFDSISDQAIMDLTPNELRQEVSRLRSQLQKISEGRGISPFSQGQTSDLQSLAHGHVTQSTNQQQALQRSAGKSNRSGAQFDEGDGEMREIPGENNQDKLTESGSQNNAKKLKDLQEALRSQEQENSSLQGQLGLLTQQGVVEGDPRVVPVLKHQIQQLMGTLQERELENQLLKQRLHRAREAEVGASQEAAPGVNGNGKDFRNQILHLQKRLQQVENLNELLKKQLQLNTQCDAAPAGFNPELIVQMAQEIERLKGELERSRKKLQEAVAAAQSQTINKPPVAPPMGRNQKQSSAALAAMRQQMESLKSDLQDGMLKTKMLQAKLAATESTVRSQTEKMKYYRGLLEDSGLMLKAPRRSCSESSLLVMEQKDLPKRVRGRSTSASIENLSRLHSPSREASPFRKLPAFDEFGQTDNVETLKVQIQQLQEQMERYKRMIRNLQLRRKSSYDSMEKLVDGSKVQDNGKSDGLSAPPGGEIGHLSTVAVLDRDSSAGHGDPPEVFRENPREGDDQVLPPGGGTRHSSMLTVVTPIGETMSYPAGDQLREIESLREELVDVQQQLQESKRLCDVLKVFGIFSFFIHSYPEWPEDMSNVLLLINLSFITLPLQVLSRFFKPK